MQPPELPDHFIAHFAQSPDQFVGLGGITFPHRRMVPLPALHETRQGRRNDLGLARVSLVVRTAPDSPRGGPNGVRSYCLGCCKLIFAPPEKFESCTVSTPSLEVPGGTSNDTTA